MTKVYLAGKIEKNCWRHDIALQLRGVSEITDYNGNYYFGTPTRRTKINHFKQTELDSISKNLFITGPFFLACDHGCYHRDSSLHALGSDIEQPYYCNGEEHKDTLTGEDVKEICLHQIEKSDYIFCWLDDRASNPFGTIYELGYAKSLNKQIIICFSSIFAMLKYKDLLPIADQIFISNDAKNGFEYFNFPLFLGEG